MKKRYKEKSAVLRKIALERIEKLFEEAAKTAEQDLSNRYVELARKIGMRYKVRIPSRLKRRFCKHCHSYLVPSKNCRVRLTGKKVVYSCLNCKKFMRFPYFKKEATSKPKPL